MQIDMSEAKIRVTPVPPEGIYFDGSIEPAKDDNGVAQPGYDVSIACDNPRSFFEDRRATLTGAGDFVRDCVAILVVEKFPVK